MTSVEYKQNISAHRSYLMGLSILWIMVHHTYFFEMYDYGYLGFFAKIGSCGVDCFLFISSFGLFHSFSKNNQLRRFYIRRVLRVLPSFIIIMVGVGLLVSPKSLLKMGYWYRAFHDNWYITFILIMYLCFPVLYYIQKKMVLLPLIICVILSFFMTIFLVSIQKDNIHDVPMLMAQRLPVFACGMLFADSRFSYKVTIKFLLFVLIGTMILLYFAYFIDREYLVYPLFCFLTIEIVLLVSSLWIKQIDGLMKWIGSLSLELYLVHMAIIPILVFHIKGLIGVLLVFFLSFVLAVLVQKIANGLTAPLYGYYNRKWESR